MSSSQPVQPGGASQDLVQQKFDLGIWHALFNWQALTVAVKDSWGGPDSADKRDWFAGAISDLFQNQPDTDAEDVEVMLLQVLEDEFDTRLEDESEVAVAAQIMKLRKETLEGNFSTVDELQAKWEARKGKPVATGDIHVTENITEADWDSVDEESGSDDEDEDGDVDMADAPSAVSKPKLEPEVDDEGFTKVVGKRRK